MYDYTWVVLDLFKKISLRFMGKRNWKKYILHWHILFSQCNRVIPPFLIELMGRKSKALLLFKNRWT
ncbi:hypothetical protein ABTA58_17795, partial [Acinetobacter baumannii]